MFTHATSGARPTPERSNAAYLGAAPQAPLFFFAGPTKTLVAHDEGDSVDGCLRDRDALATVAEARLRGASQGARRFLVGAVPFHESAPVRLFCPQRASEFGRWITREPAPTGAFAPSPGAARVQVDDGDPEAFMASVRSAVDTIGHGKLRKVVLSRMKEWQLASPPDLATLLARLRARNPHGFTFALKCAPSAGEAREGEARLVGASPELLLSRRGMRVVSAPLAGSVPRAADAVEDRARAARLARSPKDHHEHRLVVEQIVEALTPFVSRLTWEREPALVATPSMWHLSTRIEGWLKDADASSLRLALALHPTPAVCGTPPGAAAEFIRGAERFDRGYFTGTLGYMDSAFDGDWLVTIRCAELSANRVRVYAGAGIVEGSQAEAELAETEAKMATMLSAFSAGGLS